MKSYDFIIVGGGAAGCIVANRVSADRKYRVLLLEAGVNSQSPLISMPAGFSKLLTDARFNWKFHTEPEDNVYGRVISVPRGKGLGGSTLINGMIYVRGQPRDYDDWAENGLPGWAFYDVEPYFRKFEHCDDNPNTGRGHDGPMHVSTVKERFELSSAFLQAAIEDGQHLNDDYNGRVQEGFGYYQVFQHRGRRWSVLDGYLRSAMRRDNLDVITGALVEKLKFEGQRCQGVVYRKGNREVLQIARRETILCAGAVQSPQLLELSGIGGPELLKRFGINVVYANSNVGENYIEHFATRMNWRVKGTTTLNERTRGLRLLGEIVKYAAFHRGVLTLGTGLVHGFVKTLPEVRPDAQYFFVNASYGDASTRVLDRKPGMTIGVAQLRPTSVGSIHIKAPAAGSEPSIRPNVLSTEEDQRCLVAAMRIARRIVGRPAMAQFVEKEISPGGAVRDDDDAAWLEFARNNGQTIYHPVGTCRAGNGPGSVVDPRLRVRGVSGLRVIDASIMPTIISGNTQGAVMAIAEKGSDMVIEDAA